MIWRHLATVHENPALCHLMFQVLRTGADYTATGVYDLNRAYTRRTLDIVREGIASGELRPDIRLGLVRDLIYGCIEHRTWAYLRGEGDFDPNKTADDIVALVLAGLTSASVQAVAEPGLAGRLERAVERLEHLVDGEPGAHREPGRAKSGEGTETRGGGKPHATR
jgi:Tetracyclin repressor-like, C-terminal domain